MARKRVILGGLFVVLALSVSGRAWSQDPMTQQPPHLGTTGAAQAPAQVPAPTAAPDPMLQPPPRISPPPTTQTPDVSPAPTSTPPPPRITPVSYTHLTLPTIYSV